MGPLIADDRNILCLTQTHIDIEGMSKYFTCIKKRKKTIKGSATVSSWTAAWWNEHQVFGFF